MTDRILGHYRIMRELGRGGMGEVYLAEDTRLKRRVALKVLPEALAGDPDRLQRFEREAQLVAALTHPNIVTIYSVEEAEGTRFLAMELVEGRTLGELIGSHGLPPDRLLRIAVPLADAIAAAHQRGVIHRDVKPSNIMVTDDGRVKVLDFGLAKLREGLSAPSDLTSLPTKEVTAAGSIFGTVAYMSPEQAQGTVVDHRSDIFSLGILLYEMATGRRPFDGGTSVSVLSSIIKDTPRSPIEVNPAIPHELDRVIRRCLPKDPERRYQTAVDVRNDLEALQQELATQPGAATSKAVAPARPGSTLRWAIGLVAIAGLALIVILLVRRTTSTSPGGMPFEASFTQLTSEPGVEQFPSLSPDGRWIVYSGFAAGNEDIYLQGVGGQLAINLTKDSPAADTQPVFSPDGDRIAFRSEREGGGLFVMGRTGEFVRRITDTGFNPAWSPDGRKLAFVTENITFNPFGRGTPSALWVVDLATGEKRRLGADDVEQPHWSPHGHRIAYWGLFQGGSRSDIRTMPAGGGDSAPVTEDEATDWNPVWSPDGEYLYFVSNRGGSMNLWRVRIEETSGKVLGPPEPVTTPAPYLAHPSVSSDGRRVAYASMLMTQNIQRVAFDPASGRTVGEPTWLTTGSRHWSSPDPSPDGQWVTFYSRLQQEDIYIIRADGTGLRQLTNDPPLDRVPRWSADSSRIAFFSNRAGNTNMIYAVNRDGSGLRQIAGSLEYPAGELGYVAWSPDGSRMAVTLGPDASARVHIFDPRVPWDQQRSEVLPPYGRDMPFVSNSWSPDGRRLAGVARVTPRLGIVAYSFDAKQYDVLSNFGEWPTWLSDGRRLLFVAGGNRVYLLDSQTKEAKEIFSATREVLGPPRPTRDDRQIYFSRRMTEADIWLLTRQ